MNRHVIQFPSRNAYDASLRTVVRKSGLFRMEKQWDTLPRYDGKTILLQGVPRNALAEDGTLFLLVTHDASSIQMFARPQRDHQPETVPVGVSSQALATHAFIKKNRGFCLNNQVAVRLLQ
ncbi:hypothetical protein HAX54_024916 [Datura stramonium]|uniref:Uncharacterized protein n=1 Tax=Datura stramonium TaxID=4076 RepID=A0ABS8V0V5_DATST|nr:hypothetical protein [Datura stramonium]